MKRFLLITFIFCPFCFNGQRQLFHANNYTAASAYDSDAQRYFDSTGITDVTFKDALNTFVLGLKSDGSWNELDFFYCLVNGTFDKCKWNLKNTAAYKLTTSGTITYSSTGADPTSGAYLNTNYNPSTSLASINSMHLMLWSKENISEAATDMGVINVTNAADIELFLGVMYSQLNSRYASGYLSASCRTDSFFISNRTSSTALEIRRNNTSLASGSHSVITIPNANVLIFTSNLVNFSTKKMAVVSGGDGITNTTAYYNRLVTFLTAIGAI